jgi:hypothetical protein
MEKSLNFTIDSLSDLPDGMLRDIVRNPSFREDLRTEAARLLYAKVGEDGLRTEDLQLFLIRLKEKQGITK